MKDFFKYQGKICIVTGAASGMGKATTEMLVELGAKVYALDYSEVKTEGIEKFIQVNLSQKEQIDKAFESIPKEIDSFFGIAGVSGESHDFTTTLTINFLANKYITDAYLKDRMKENGSIAYITSMGGQYWENYLEETKPLVEAKVWEETIQAIEALNVTYRVGAIAYMLSKRAMNHYASDRVEDFIKRKVRINYVMPAMTITGLTDEFAKMKGGTDNLVTGLADRLATAEEMAAPLVFLNSDMASYISGVGLVIDSGNTVMEILSKYEKRTNFPMIQPVNS